jgi:hypothetical protein
MSGMVYITASEWGVFFCIEFQGKDANHVG